MEQVRRTGMERRRFGPTGSEIPVIGQGTWQIDESDRASVVAALRRGLDLGMNHIDTAEMYGDSEVIVAKAIDGRRDEVFLISKVLPQNSSRTGTIAACERSLARLRTDHLDCYLLHWRGEHPLEDTFAAFEQLQREGKVLSWGVSNFDKPDLDEALEIAGEGQLICNQVLYHLEQRRKSGVSSSFWPEKTNRHRAKKARERRIVGNLKPFRWNPAGNQSRPVEPDQQPEASLAWWVGDHPCEA